MQMLLDWVPPHHNPPLAEVLPGGIFTKGVTTLQQTSWETKTREPPFDLMPWELQGLTKLTRSMLEKDMHRRPQAQQVLRDVWFTIEPQEQSHQPLKPGTSSAALGEPLEMFMSFFNVM